MKNTINPTQHGNTNTIDTIAAGNAPVQHVFKLGLDMDLHWVVTAVQCDRGTVAWPQKLTRGQLIAWVQKQIAAGPHQKRGPAFVRSGI